MVLDAIDLKILAQLQKDSNLSSAEVAERVGLSQSPCWRRIQRLEAAGFVSGHVALLDRKRLGLNVQIFAHVKLDAHGRKSLPEFAQAIKRFPEVLECHVLMGEVDFLLRIVTRDVETYERFFFEHLSQIPQVREVNSMIALSAIKETTALPLELVQPAARSS